MEKQRTIRVTGKGTLKLRPDLTRLNLTLQGTDADYGAALKQSAADTGTLRAALEALGLEDLDDIGLGGCRKRHRP